MTVVQIRCFLSEFFACDMERKGYLIGSLYILKQILENIERISEMCTKQLKTSFAYVKSYVSDMPWIMMMILMIL